MTEYFELEGKPKVITTKISWEAWLELENRARSSGLSIYQLTRQILETALLGKPQQQREEIQFEETSIFPLLRWWWEHVVHEDPGLLDGAKMRAEGLGMTFDHKFRTALKLLFEHGLL